MKLIVGLLLISALLVLTGGSTAAQDPAEAQEPVAAGENAEEPLKTFVPSEKLPADSAISFPVDI